MSEVERQVIRLIREKITELVECAEAKQAALTKEEDAKRISVSVAASVRRQFEDEERLGEHSLFAQAVRELVESAEENPELDEYARAVLRTLLEQLSAD